MASKRSTAAALLFAALNLRLAVAAVPPVLEQIRHSTGLSSAGGGVLTAIPVFCFGAVALASPSLIRRFGLRPLLTLVLGAIVAGSLLRLLSPVAALFAGTAVVGGAIAVGNVLVPGLIKRDFSGERVRMTAFYSVALSLGGGLAAGLTVPIEHLTGLGWREAVAGWAVLGVLGLIGWGPHTRGERAGRRAASGGGGPEAPAVAEVAPGLWRDRTAWSVTLFMGLQSLGFYSTLSWVPTLLEAHGVTAGTAGWLLSYSTIPSALAALVTPSIERRLHRPGLMVLAAGSLVGGGYLGLLLDPAGGAYAWMSLLGLGQGMSLALGLGYIVARAGDGAQAAQLSTMAQGIGYMLAAAGPFAVGALHGVTGGWTVPFLFLLVLLLPFGLAGAVAARPGHVLER